MHNDENHLQEYNRLYDKLWECRRFELEHLWQRSIFLATFLVLIFSGYGILMSKIGSSLGNGVSSEGAGDELFFLNGCGIAISLVGIAFSILWIAMGKGSKAWYERYQNALKQLEKKNPSPSQIRNDNNIPIGVFNCDELGDLSSEDAEADTDTSLYSTNAGAFSCSRINIVIGQISFAIWAVAFFVHLCTLIHLKLHIFHLDYANPAILLPICAFILFLPFLLTSLIKRKIKSNTLLGSRLKR